MTDSLLTSALTVVMAIIGVAILAIILSRNATTGQTLIQGAQALSTGLQAAEAPITGGGLGLSFGGIGSGFTGGAL